MMPVILVIDLGLTNCKALAIKVDGEILGQSTVSYPTYHPAPGFVEQDPEEWWRAACQVTREVLKARPELATRIAAISVTAHMHALVALDRDMLPLHRAIVLGDRRSVNSAAMITAELGLESIYRITGARMEESMPAAKIHWLTAQSKGYLASVHLFSGCKDFVRGRMTGGDRLTDPTDACAVSLYDLKTGHWSPDLLMAANISAGHLPDISAPTAIAGELTSKAAQELGLQEGIPVVVGSGDDVEVLGAGLHAPGGTIEHLGTTGSFLCCSNQLVYDPAMALEIYPHVDPEMWVVGGSITSAGGTLAWAAETLGFGDVSSVFEAGVDINASSTRESLVFMPHLSGERCPGWNPRVRGSWVGLSKGHTREDLMRAAFVGTAFALNSILTRINGLIGELSDLRVVRREQDSDEWLQLRANVYGQPLGVLDTVEPTALGAMLLGAIGIGVYKNFQEAVASLDSVARTVQPDAGNQAWFSRRFALYEKIHERMGPVWDDMDELEAISSANGISSQHYNWKAAI